MKAGEYTLDALLNECKNPLPGSCMDLADLDVMATRNTGICASCLWAGVRMQPWQGHQMPCPLIAFALLLADGDAITHYAEAISESMGWGEAEQEGK